MQTNSHRWTVAENCHEASVQVADFLAEKILSFIDSNNVCHVVLPGGNTPIESLRLLAKKKIDWQKVHWYLGDERCVAVGHADRNDVMLENNLWCSMPNTHIHRMPAELGADAGAKRYQQDIKDITAFDIAYLGMGEDGHTASLFPDHEALTNNAPVIPVYHSPKPPSDRVSLSLDTLRKTKIRVVLSCGEGKASILNKIKAGEALPVNSMGDVEWFIDKAANAD